MANVISPPDEEPGPDPNRVRRHAKKMLTNAEYRRRYRALDFYGPNRFQLALHNATAREVMGRSGNQVGKTHALSAELAMAATQLYAPWHRGRQFLVPPKLQRAYDFVGWYASNTQATLKQSLQTLLLGDIMAEGGLGSGLLPLDYIRKVSPARGVADVVDSVVVAREGGGTALLSGKTYGSGRELFQGVAVDLIALDEDLSTANGDWAIYTECQARVTTTAGIIRVALTPVPGRTALVKHFYPGSFGTAVVEGTYEDAFVSNGGHVPDEERATIENKYHEHVRRTRLYGEPAMGEGCVFSMQPDAIAHDVTLEQAMSHPQLRWIGALDFRHSGSATTGHPFAAVICCHDAEGILGQNADCLLVMHCVRMLGNAPEHVAQIKSHPCWRVPWAYGHDAGRGGSIQSGDTLKTIYAKLGLRMRPQFAAIRTAGHVDYGAEAWVTQAELRMTTGRLKVARGLHPWFSEYADFHRENGLIVAVDEDLLSATGKAILDIGGARSLMEADNRARQSAGGPLPPEYRFARGSPSHPDGSFDLWGSR